MLGEGDSTPHALWKGMCRIMESKPFVRRFGTTIARDLDSFAVFEIGREQADVISKTGLEMTDDHPVPPFPFPKMLLILPQYVLALEQPEMDVASSTLEYRSTLYMPFAGKHSHEEFAFSRVRLDIAESIKQQRFVSEVLDVKSMVFLQGGLRVRSYPPSENDPTDLNEEILQKSLDPNQTARFSPEGREELAVLIKEIQEKEEGLRREVDDYVRLCFAIGLQAVSWINRPKNFIIEQGPETPRKPGKKDRDRAPRLGERSRYIMLSHDEVRRRWTEGQGTHASPMPHLRRGHFKTLRAERFGDNRGKVIWVSPCHVNGACVEWRQGSVTYKVVG